MRVEVCTVSNDREVLLYCIRYCLKFVLVDFAGSAHVTLRAFRV